jgi:hypothetical protein
MGSIFDEEGEMRERSRGFSTIALVTVNSAKMLFPLKMTFFTSSNDI